MQGWFPGFGVAFRPDTATFPGFLHPVASRRALRSVTVAGAAPVSHRLPNSPLSPAAPCNGNDNIFESGRFAQKRLRRYRMYGSDNLFARCGQIHILTTDGDHPQDTGALVPRDSRRGLRGKPVRNRRCPRNCKRRAKLNCHWECLPGRPAERRPASQETCQSTRDDDRRRRASGRAQGRRPAESQPTMRRPLPGRTEKGTEQ